MVLRRFQTNTNHVAGRQILRIPVDIWFCDREVAVLGFANKTVLPDMVVVGVQQEVNVAAGVGEPEP